MGISKTGWLEVTGNEITTTVTDISEKRNRNWMRDEQVCMSQWTFKPTNYILTGGNLKESTAFQDKLFECIRTSGKYIFAIYSCSRWNLP